MTSSAERSLRNAFAVPALDRCHEFRDDPAWIAAQRVLPAARWLGFAADGRIAVAGTHLASVVVPAPDAPANFLGRVDAAPVFALREPVGHDCASGASWLGLRGAAGVLAPAEAGIAAYAQGLANWQAGLRFCPRCAGALTFEDGGHRARCMACGQLQFPRTDPAIIVIVEHAGACLLGRQAAWAPHQYSTLAGFVEPGETLAAAVCREVAEETGVEVLDCDFHSSQPWPFPASLMLGFTAQAAGRAIRLADGELEDARWFTPDAIARGLADGSLRLSTPASISFRLIEHWLRSRAGMELSSLPRAQ